MGQILHGSATTTEAVRRAIQNSEASLRTLSRRYGINQKTVAKWEKRTSVADLATGPKDPHSTVLSLEEEAIIVAFRKHSYGAHRQWRPVHQPGPSHIRLPPHIRPGLRRERHRAQANQTQASLDEWAGGTDEPDHQGSHRQALPLR